MDDGSVTTTTIKNENATTATTTTTRGGGVLETSKAERAVWLMKCPGLVSRSLAAAPPPPSSSSSSMTTSSFVNKNEPPRPVAKVILSIDPLALNDDETNSSSTKFTMELAATESGDVLKSYSMDMSKDLVPMAVFAESSQAGKVTVEGKIRNKFDLRPHYTDLENYGKLCRQRTSKYTTKTRQTQVIPDDNGSHMRPMPWMFEPVSSSTEKKKGSDTKRTRRDRKDMDCIMFKLFERQPNWTLRQLIQETDQPEQFLKEILKDLCVYNNKGTNQGSYELKPEYKKSDAEESGK